MKKNREIIWRIIRKLNDMIKMGNEINKKKKKKDKNIKKNKKELKEKNIRNRDSLTLKFLLISNHI